METAVITALGALPLKEKASFVSFRLQMSFLQSMNIIHNLIGANSLITLATTSVLVCTTLYFLFRRGPYDHIPTVGSSNWLLSYFDAIRYVIRGPQMLQEGYDKFGKEGGVFRVPSITSWLVIVCSDKLIDEMRSPKGEEELSAEIAGRELMSGDFTIGRPIYENPYHMPILRSRLTKSLDVWFGSIKDEVVTVFEELIPSATDWKPVKLFHTSTQIVSRSASRVFVSDPNIYRNPNYIHLVLGFTLDTALGAFILGLFPNILKPLARKYLTNIPRAVASATEFLRDTVKARQAKINEYGLDYPDKENDMLSFFMDEAEGEERTEERLALRMLMVNFASIHTTSMTLSSVLRDLAEQPEYIEPLREEIQSVISEHGWTKASLSYMQKLESFIMESQRLRTSRAVTSMRWSVKDYTFSNGIRIPKHTMVAIPMRARHYDSTIFNDPHKFDALRFFQPENANSWNIHLTSANSPFLLFGVGKHICPGRFFAANILKTALAYFLLTYDVKLDMANLARDSWIGPDLLPNDTTTLLVRERKMRD